MKKSKEFFRCLYCKKDVTLEELKGVDEEIKVQESDILEEIYDHFPKNAEDENRKPPFIHNSELKYPFLNICKACWDNAKYQALEIEERIKR